VPLFVVRVFRVWKLFFMVLLSLPPCG